MENYLNRWIFHLIWSRASKKQKILKHILENGKKKGFHYFPGAVWGRQKNPCSWELCSVSGTLEPKVSLQWHQARSITLFIAPGSMKYPTRWKTWGRGMTDDASVVAVWDAHPTGQMSDGPDVSPQHLCSMYDPKDILERTCFLSHFLEESGF